MTRKITIPPILPETFEKVVAPWLTGIAKKDIVAVMSYPASDRQRRVLQLLADKKIQRKYLGPPKRFLWISIDFRLDPIDDVIDLEHHIQNATHGKKGQKVILICMGCEKLLQKQYVPLLIWFTVQCRVDSLRMLLFFEANLFRDDVLNLLSRVPAFQPRISVMTLYQELDVRKFLVYLENKWSFTVPDSMKEEILLQCGGAFLLVKEAMRHLRDHPDTSSAQVFSHTEMKFNLALFWNGFDTHEQDVFDAIVTRNDIQKTMYTSVDYLKQAGFIKQKGNRYICCVPLFLQFRQAMIAQSRRLSVNQQGEIELDGVIVSSHFSRIQRRILTKLIERRSRLITRSDIASAIWPGKTEEKYSDWAIDSHISRLRTKFFQQGITQELLRTVKASGFILDQQEVTI